MKPAPLTIAQKLELDRRNKLGDTLKECIGDGAWIRPHKPLITMNSREEAKIAAELLCALYPEDNFRAVSADRRDPFHVVVCRFPDETPENCNELTWWQYNDDEEDYDYCKRRWWHLAKKPAHVENRRPDGPIYTEACRREREELQVLVDAVTEARILAHPDDILTHPTVLDAWVTVALLKAKFPGDVFRWEYGNEDNGYDWNTAVLVLKQNK